MDFLELFIVFHVSKGRDVAFTTDNDIELETAKNQVSVKLPQLLLTKSTLQNSVTLLITIAFHCHEIFSKKISP